MDNLIDKIVSEVAFNGAVYIRIPAGIGLFTEVIIFEEVLGHMPPFDEVPRVDEDVAEMTFEVCEMELRQLNKYKWLQYCIQHVIRCCEHCCQITCRDTN